MLYIVALRPPPSALVMMNTIRSSLPACSVPCQLPGMFCAWAWTRPADSMTMKTRRISVFIGGSVTSRGA